MFGYYLYNILTNFLKTCEEPYIKLLSLLTQKKKMLSAFMEKKWLKFQ